MKRRSTEIFLEHGLIITMVLHQQAQQLQSKEAKQSHLPMMDLLTQQMV